MHVVPELQHQQRRQHHLHVLLRLLQRDRLDNDLCVHRFAFVQLARTRAALFSPCSPECALTPSTACSNNTYSLAGASSCTSCPAGSVSGTAASICLCLPGYALSGSTAQTLTCTGAHAQSLSLARALVAHSDGHRAPLFSPRSLRCWLVQRQRCDLCQ